jgi:hypothetical protein
VNTFSITLTMPCILSSGTHWVSVQANLNFFPDGQWSWFARAPQANNGAVFRNPGNGFATGCTSFGRRTTCVGGGCPDQAFLLGGLVGTPFDVCLQDETTRDVLLLNSQTGDYIFQRCGAGGFTLTGTGTVLVKGGIITLQHNAPDRRVLARVDTTQKKGTATVQRFSPSATYTITDRNITDNTCACP